MINIRDDWEFNVLGIYNFRRPGRIGRLCNFIRENHERISGDIVEAGVYRGSSIIALGMLLKELGSSKKVYGFDSFSGFPPVYHQKDDLSQFERMHARKMIADDHIEAVRRNRRWWATLHSQKESVPTPAQISSSGGFDATSIDLVRRKIDLVGLDNIVLVDGPFSETMPRAEQPECIMAVVMDCDLYQSHLDTFNAFWPRICAGGMVHLDEYYSLKFPGARLATDEFLEGKRAQLVMEPREPGDFERWHLIKEA